MASARRCFISPLKQRNSGSSSGEPGIYASSSSPESSDRSMCRLPISSPEKERMVLTLYYYEELTMKEIGLTLGVVESRVSQIHSSAVLRLRTALAGLRNGGLIGKSGL